MTTITLKALWIYPVKSLAGIQLNSARIRATGLEGDREWMIVNAEGKFVTQRQLPSLATIITGHNTLGELQLTAPNGETVGVPAPDGPSQPVRVWRDECLAKIAPKAINEWLTRTAESNSELRLVQFDKSRQRANNEERFGSASTYFADAAPLLLCNQQSLNSLNQHLISEGTAAIDMRRFRPNLVVDGVDAFSEHQYTRLCNVEQPALQLGLVDHCQRCAIITVNQSTGQRDKGAVPFKQLAQINSMPHNHKAPAFGVNSILLGGDGLMLSCGETFTKDH